MASIELSDYSLARDADKILGIWWQGIGGAVLTTIAP
jgi:hypothetical protein